MLHGTPEYFVSVRCQESLVCCNDMFPSSHGGQDKGARGFVSAHQFNHNINVRIIQNLGRIVCQEFPLDGNLSGSIDIEVRDFPQMNFSAQTPGDDAFIFFQQPDNARTDGTETDHAYGNKFLHGFVPDVLCNGISMPYQNAVHLYQFIPFCQNNSSFMVHPVLASSNRFPQRQSRTSRSS